MGIKITMDGFDDFEKEVIAAIEEETAEAIVDEAIKEGLDSIDQVKITPDSSAGTISMDRVRRRAEELFNQRHR